MVGNPPDNFGVMITISFEHVVQKRVNKLIYMVAHIDIIVIPFRIEVLWVSKMLKGIWIQWDEDIYKLDGPQYRSSYSHPPLNFGSPLIHAQID